MAAKINRNSCDSSLLLEAGNKALKRRSIPYSFTTAVAMVCNIAAPVVMYCAVAEVFGDAKLFSRPAFRHATLPSEGFADET